MRICLLFYILEYCDLIILYKLFIMHVNHIDVNRKFSGAIKGFSDKRLNSFKFGKVSFFR